MKTNRLKYAAHSSSDHSRNLASFTSQPSASRSTSPSLATENLNRFTALQEQVAASLEQEFAGTIETQFIRQIVNEAAALAATTPVPALLLPALAEEKARQASEWAERQRAIRSSAFILAA